MYLSKLLLATFYVSIFSVSGSVMSAEPLEDGGVVSGSIEIGGGEDQYEFYALTGQTISLSMVDLNGGDPNMAGDLTPYIYLYDPNGVLLSSDYDNVGAQIVNRQVPLNGTYTVRATSRFNTQTGPYAIHFAKAPGAQEHGVLVNGGVVSEALTIGDLDSYTFYGETGDTVSISMVDLNGSDPNLAGNLTPYTYLYDPNGTLITSDYDGIAAQLINRSLPLNGTYTLLAKSRFSSESGPYEIHFAKMKGAQEHGGLLNGDKVTESLTSGDIDTYTFYAETGDTVAISMVDINGVDPNLPGNLTPYIYLYDPNGTLVTSDYDNSAAQIINRNIPLNGTYTLVAKSRFPVEYGPYEVHLALAAGAKEHGALINGELANEMITTGDIDSYVFYGSSGDTVSIAMSDLNGSDPNSPGNITPYIYLYNPDGSLNTSDYDNVVASINNRPLTTNGTYTVIAKSRFSSETGPYSIELTSTNQSLPARVTLLGPSGDGFARKPALGWTPSGHAKYYLVHMRDMAGSRYYWRVFSAKALGCEGGMGFCSIESRVVVDRPLRWWVRPLNNFGFGQWSMPRIFSTVSGIPARSNAIAPNGGSTSFSTPRYEWTRVANASRYRILIRDETGIRVRSDITAGEAGCVQAGQSCSYRFNTSVRGDVSWYVRSYNSQGFARWGAGGSFSVN